MASYTLRPSNTSFYLWTEFWLDSRSLPHFLKNFTNILFLLYAHKIECILSCFVFFSIWWNMPLYLFSFGPYLSSVYHFIIPLSFKIVDYPDNLTLSIQDSCDCTLCLCHFFIQLKKTTPVPQNWITLTLCSLILYDLLKSIFIIYKILNILTNRPPRFWLI